MITDKAYSIQPSGDHAVTVYFGDRIDAGVNKAALEFALLLSRQRMAGVLDIIPAYASVTVVYDPLRVERGDCITVSASIMEQLEALLKQEDRTLPGPHRLIRIPVCYDTSLGPDLEEMAAAKRISIDTIVRLHSAIQYRVFMIGFLPGFAYMGTVDERIVTPRKAVPRQLVPAGSVGIAGAQTGIYPSGSPGGWNIIGRTPIKLFDKNWPEPCLLNPGDEVLFEPVTLQEFEEIKQSQ